MPTISLDSARTKIIEEFERDPIGFRAPETLDMKVEGGYLPVWFVEATIHCSWYGKYSETRTVTKYRSVTKHRTVTKTRLNGEPYSTTESYTEQEPYTDTETVWHPCNGAHDFAAFFKMPANGDFALENAFLPREFDPGKTQSGFPTPEPKHLVHPATVTQREAWEKHGCLALITEQANRECASQAEQLEKVVPKVDRADFMLVFLPFAVVTYSANGREYRHLFDLTDGSFTGDMVALDHTSVDAEGLDSAVHLAHTSQREIDKKIADGQAEIARKRRDIFSPVRKWGWAFALPGLLFFVAAGSGYGLIWALFWLVLIGVSVKFLIIRSKASSEAEAMKQGIEAGFPKETPWRTFITDRRRDLLRLRRIVGDRTTITSQLPPDEAEKHSEHMQRLRQLEGEDSPQAVQEAERIACSLCEVPPSLPAEMSR